MISQLRARYPWPDARPDVPEDWHGWLCPETAQALAGHLSPSTRLVVECGSWLGMSARLILDGAPCAALVCIDHWKGSPEHQPQNGPREWSRRLPGLYDTFLRNLWPWRDRVVPLRADTLDGLAEVAGCGLEPDLVYVDSEHTADRVSRELAFSTGTWPRAWIVGDDYVNPAVASAAEEHAATARRPIQRRGAAFLFPPRSIVP